MANGRDKEVTKNEAIEAAYYDLFIGPTHTRTEERTPVWGSEFTTKAAKPQGDSAEFFPGIN
jgi:TorA maturation chaperone TorD